MAYTPEPWLTSCQAHGTKSLWYLSAPYLARFTTLCVTSNDGSSSNSTSATSGAPEPALSASEIFTYSGSPAPTSASVTQIDGWVLLNSLTARSMPGTQAQNVMFVAPDDLQDAPASTVLPGVGLGLLEDFVEGVLEEVPLLPQPARTDTAAAAASQATARAAGSLRRAVPEVTAAREVRVMPERLIRVSVNIFGGSLRVKSRIGAGGGTCRLLTCRRRLDDGERLWWEREGQRGALRLLRPFLQARTLDIGEDAGVPPALRGEAPDFDDAVERHVAEHDLDVFRLVRVPVHERQREPPVLAGGRRGVHEAERGEVGDPVRPPAVMPVGERADRGAVDVHVDRGGQRRLCVQQDRVVDRLSDRGLRRGDDRRDRVHHLRQVRHPDPAAVPDEDVQVGGHGQGVGEVVALLERAVVRAVPDVPLVVGDAWRPRDLLHVRRALDQRLSAVDCALGLVRLQHVGPVVVGTGVDVQRVQVDQGRHAVDDHPVPVVPAVHAAADQYCIRVKHLDRPCPPGCLAYILLGGQRADLPVAVHLVAQAPVADPVGRVMAVAPAPLRPGRLASAVAVLDPGQRFLQRAGPHVQADVRLGAQLGAVAEELVGAEPVALLAAPGELGAPRPGVLWPDPIRPVVVADEVAARPAQHAHPQLAQQAQHVVAEAALVGQRRALLVDAAVDAAAQVLDEAAEHLAVELAEGPGGVDGDAGHPASSPERGGGAPGGWPLPQDSRTISSTGSRTGSSGTGSPAMLRSSSSTAFSPVSANGTRSEVSGGIRYSANGMSSQLTTATSAGTRR